MMSSEERWRAAQDVYGQEDVVMEETPEFVTLKLERFEEELDAVPEKEAYELALFTNQEYVESADFRLMFLRADRFDERAASRRMVKYWNRKIELFGTDRAFRPIFFSLDLNKMDKAALEKGGFRIMPRLDEAGRPILLSYRPYYDNRSDHSESMMRLLWCMCHVAVTNPEMGIDAQKNGIIALGSSGIPEGSPLETAITILARSIPSFWEDLQNSLPVRIVSMHVFAPNKWHQHFIACSELVHMNIAMLARYRQYCGANEHYIQQLADCGMSPEIVPKELGGQLEFDYREWLSELLHTERMQLEQFRIQRE